jgi:hypothetical protein
MSAYCPQISAGADWVFSHHVPESVGIFMTGKAEKTESKRPTTNQSEEHTEAFRDDAFRPPLNHRVMNSDGTVQPGKHGPGPKLTDLTIDEEHVKVYDTPRRDASAAEKAAAAKREMPISNEHFRDLVRQGSEFIQANGGFNLAMRNALEEAHQTDKFAGNGKHEHIDQMLKWIDNDLSGSFYTLRREGNKIQVFDTHWSDTKPQGSYDLNKRTWDK